MTDAPRISDAPLREKVARALCGDEMGIEACRCQQVSVSCYRGADAAIRVCREHFAGVAESMDGRDDGGFTHGGKDIATAIREDGK